MKLGIEFAQIDAKGDAYTGYSPVAFYDKGNDTELAEWTKPLERLQIRLKREYLTRLHQMQEHLRAKYLREAKYLDHEAVSNKAIDDAYGHVLNALEYNRAKKEAQAEFPGKEANYYT